MRKLAVILAAIAVAIVPAAFLSQAGAASRYVVTLQVSKTGIAQGTQVVVSGKVSPTAKDSVVSIQYFDIDQDGNRWRTIDHATVKPDGTYARTITPRDGSASYRVFKSAGSGLSSGASGPVVIRAYAWYPIAYNTDLVYYGEQYLGQYGTQTVNGIPVEHYWATTAAATGATRWSTVRSCTRLRVSVGMDDRSTAGADAQFRVHADADLIYSLRVKKGTMAPADLAVPRADTATIKFSAEARNTLTPTYVNASNPRLYCAFPEGD